jgi:hypothetical protein
MTFTFGGDLSVDRDFVRFYSGDTDSERAFLSDELIASLVTEAGSKQQAVIDAIDYIITQLSQPDFRADWLQMSFGEARKGYETRLKDMRRKFGLNAITARSGHVYRPDSRASEAPTFENPVGSGYEDEDCEPSW